jgi:hypothetical protein
MHMTRHSGPDTFSIVAVTFVLGFVLASGALEAASSTDEIQAPQTIASDVSDVPDLQAPRG